MININDNREAAVVYPCGVCNLNCRYCTIDKNPVLLDIDNELEESFKGDYYFNRIKEYFPRRNQLKRLETWGGEPFLHMDRTYPLVHQLINYYPYFDTMYSSTNFSFDDWLNQFMGLMNVFAQYPYRDFNYTLQLSVDGPPYINDTNRGADVSKRCVANFDKLVALIKDNQFPKNVKLTCTLKGTWDTESIKQLNNKERLIEFFKYYEDTYIDKIRQLNLPNIEFACNVPNMAVPSPATKEDGKVFANLVKLCREIENENLVQKYFKYYEIITPFHSYNICQNCHSFFGDGARCGSGMSILGFLPHNMVSACHEGFTLLAENYKKFAAGRSDKGLTVSLNKFFELNPTPMCLTDDEYIEHERKMTYLQENIPTQMSIATTNVIALAMAGLIEPQYLNEVRALEAAKYVVLNTTFCIKANYAMTGSFCTESPGLYILLLNGALEYLQQGGICNA